MAHTSAPHVPNLACRVSLETFAGQRERRGVGYGERRGCLRETLALVFITPWLLNRLKPVVRGAPFSETAVRILGGSWKRRPTSHVYVV